MSMWKSEIDKIQWTASPFIDEKGNYEKDWATRLTSLNIAQKYNITLFVQKTSPNTDVWVEFRRLDKKILDKHISVTGVWEKFQCESPIDESGKPLNVYLCIKWAENNPNQKVYYEDFAVSLS